MGGLFGGKPMRQETPVVSSLKMSTSVQGRPIGLVLGKNRVSPNCIYYGNFIATQHEQQQGGKGGGGGMTTVNNTYTVGVQMAVCAGPIESYGTLYLAKQKGSLSEFGFSQGLGTATQTPWDYYAGSADADKGLAYRGLAWIANSALDLGGDPTLPNINVEVQSTIKDAASTSGDANPAQIIYELLTNTGYGLGWNPAKIASLTDFTNYCRAAGLFFSPSYAEQKPARDLLRQIALLTGADYVWSNGRLKIIPYADGALTGNGTTWTPDLTPAYDLTDDDLLEPATLTRGAQSDAHNIVSIKFNDRNNEYNESVADAREQANIEEFGQRKADALDAPEIVSASTAGACAQLMLQRGLYIRNKYQVKLPWSFVRLEPMDLVTLTDSGLGLDRQLLRVLEKSEDSSGELEFTFEEVPVGAAAVSRYPVEVSTGYAVDYNVAPGNANTPIVLELPTTLTNGDHVLAIATSGGVEWGGCDVWVSDDNATYRRIGRIANKARHGVLTASLPSGATTDTTNHAYVDLTVSKGELLPGTTANANELVTLCWVGGEYFAYRDAALTGANQYNLSYLVRGAHGSAIAAHASGEKFVRIDDALGRFDASTLTVGKTIYIKLQSFNRYGSGMQDLSAVSPVTYTLAGAPLASVSGLDLEQAFTGTGCKIKWNATPGATSYKIEVYSGASLKRTVTIGDALRYEYTWEDAKADGGPYRSLTFRLKAITDNSESATWAQLTATNDAPAALSGLSVTGGWETLSFKCTKPTDPDFANILIYISTTSGFTPDANSLVYQGPANTVTIDRLNNGTLLVGGTNYYLRAAASDLFGATGLNMSSELTAQPLSAAGAIKPGDIVSEMLSDLAVPEKFGAVKMTQIQLHGSGLNNSSGVYLRLNGSETGWGGRGLTVWVLNRTTHAIESMSTYDVYEGGAHFAAMASALNALSSAKIVCIASFDAINFDADLRAALKRCGASPAIDSVTYADRFPYALIGFPGIGEGNGVEMLKSVNPSDPPADVGAWLVDNQLIGIGSGVSSNSLYSVNNRVGAVESNLSSNYWSAATTSGAISALSTSLTTAYGAADAATLSSANSYADSAISTYSYSKSTVDSAIATSTATVNARLNTGGDVNSAIVTAQSTATASQNSVNAKHTLKVQAGNFIAGITLSADSGGGESAMVLLADQFAFASPSAGVGSPYYYPFVMGMVNGVSQAGINGNLVVDGSIYARHISVTTLAAISANIGTVTAGKVQNAAGTNYMDLDATGPSYFISTPNFKVTAAGDVTMTGTLSAGSVIAANVVTTDSMQLNSATAPSGSSLVSDTSTTSSEITVASVTVDTGGRPILLWSLLSAITGASSNPGTGTVVIRVRINGTAIRTKTITRVVGATEVLAVSEVTNMFIPSPGSGSLTVALSVQCNANPYTAGIKGTAAAGASDGCYLFVLGAKR